MSGAPIVLPGGQSIAAELDSDSDVVQSTHDGAVQAAVVSAAAQIVAAVLEGPEAAAVALDAPTLAALEAITVANPTDVSALATQTTAVAILAALNGTLKVKTAGTYAYAAGTVAATVDVPTLARLTRVSVIAGATVAATVTIGGGATITIPAGGAFDEQIPGDAIGADVVIGGTVQAYYVAWVV